MIQYRHWLTTTALLEASNTCIVGWLYFGAILTAVWVLEWKNELHQIGDKNYYKFSNSITNNKPKQTTT